MEDNRNQKLRAFLFNGLVLWFAFSIYVIGAAAFRSRHQPRYGRYTYADFVADGIPVKEARAVTAPPGSICVIGEEPPLWTLPSGSPVYVFDAQGVLIDYTHDVGDDGKFARRWSPYSGQPVSLDSLNGLLPK